MEVGVVGGSLGGLTAALTLADAGATVTVYERSSTELAQRGAGIGFLPESQRYLVERAGVDIDDISIATSFIRYLRRDGDILHEEPHGYRFSSWNTVYRRLLGCLRPGVMRLAHEAVDWHDDGTKVRITFANGNSVACDLAVFADGVGSAARARLLPGARPRYAGYVAWRGTVPESSLPGAVRDRLMDSITYHVFANSHILVYPIPGIDGEVGAGSRLVNFVWYRNYTEGGDLEDLLTDDDGTRREISIPPGSVSRRHVSEMRATAEARLPDVLAHVVVGAEQPFVQVVFDLDVDKVAFGRTCLIGDAAFLARPHAAAGTAKAADDAWSLADALAPVIAGGEGLDAALRRWESERMTVGRGLLKRTQDIGRRSQVDNSWVPGDPDLIFGLKAPGR